MKGSETDMNVFDTNKNHEEWIQNDWESDDYMRQSKSRKTVEKNDDNMIYVHGFWRALYILFFRSSILSAIAWIVLIFVIYKFACFCLDQYFIHAFPEHAHLWQ